MDVQLLIERWVLKPEIANLSRQAFLSHIKSFGAYPKNVKSLFSVKNLHLGHLAKTFGLRETPGEIVNHSSNKELKKLHQDQINNAKQVKKRKVYDEWDLPGEEGEEISSKKRGVKRLLMQGPKAGKKTKK